jgi:hypothetical protein
MDEGTELYYEIICTILRAQPCSRAELAEHLSAFAVAWAGDNGKPIDKAFISRRIEHIVGATERLTRPGIEFITCQMARSLLE